MNKKAIWKKNFEPNEILLKLEETRVIEGDNVSFSGGFDLVDKLAVLMSMIEFPNDIHSEVAKKLLSKSVFICSKNEKIRTNDIIIQINKRLQDYYKQPLNHYYLVTTINIKPTVDIPRCVIDKCYINFYPKIPKKFSNMRNKALSDVSSWLISEDEKNVTFIVASIKEKNEDIAVKKILNSIDFLRGIWNLRLNPSIRFQFGRRKSQVNQVVLGALHTLHEKNGCLASNQYWYDPDYFLNDDRVDLGKVHDLFSYTKKVRRVLNVHSYRELIVKCIMMYVKALDSRNYNVVITSLWSVLESLTNTGVNNSYKTTISRTIFGLKDRQYHKAVLEHLRVTRNSIVHTGLNNGENDIHIFQLKRYVTGLLLFHLRNPLNFESIDEYSSVFDLKPDIAELLKKRKLFDKGIKFLG